jgi:hypothetical protein
MSQKSRRELMGMLPVATELGIDPPWTTAGLGKSKRHSHPKQDARDSMRRHNITRAMLGSARRPS